MRIAVYGAGAIGGHLAVRLAQLPNLSVTVIARGAHLDAIRDRGLRLETADGALHCRPHATDDPARAEPQDLIFVTLKAPSIPEQAEGIARLLRPDGRAVFFTNGIPWWMAAGCAASRVDPDRRIEKLVGLQRALGGVVYSTNKVVAPGIVRHQSHDQWVIGEPDGTQSQRTEDIAALLRKAGLNGEAVANLPEIIWRKLVLNASSNPLCALTRSSTAVFAEDAQLAALLLALRQEVAAVAAAMGCPISDMPGLASCEDIAAAAPVEPSMLQDVQAGRPLEVEAILGQLQAFARAKNVDVPALDVVLPLLRGLDRAIRSAR